MTLPISYPTPSLTSIPLDTILSAAYPAMVKQAAYLESNKAFTVFRYLVCRLHDAGRGNLINATLTFAQTSLGERLGMSRQWVGILVARLEAAGWIEHDSRKLPDGSNGSSMWRVGRKLQWLLVRLAKSKQRKLPTKSPDKSTWQFSPHPREKKILELLARENEPPTPAMLERIPLLKRWMERGRGTT